MKCLNQLKPPVNSQHAKTPATESIAPNTRAFSLRAGWSATSCAAQHIPAATIQATKEYASSYSDAIRFARLLGFAAASLHLLTLTTLSQSPKAAHDSI
jgi:hypothetical protein